MVAWSLMSSWTARLPRMSGGMFVSPIPVSGPFFVAKKGPATAYEILIAVIYARPCKITP